MTRRLPHALFVPPIRGIALAIGLAGCGARAGSARGPPLAVDIALERARQALCADRGVESIRALVASFAPAEPCASAGLAARVRCYLAQPDTTIEVARVRDDEVRVRFAIPRLSDHVHEVRVRRHGGGLAVEVDSTN